MTTERAKTQRDSFEDVDRILAIVEESKAKYEKGKENFQLILFVFGSWIGFVSKDDFWGKVVNSFSGELYVEPSLIVLTLGFFLFLTFIYERLLSKRKDYKQTALHAADVIREAIPFLAESENWSPLRKFELNLRLSRLGISEADRAAKKPYPVFDDPANR
jgi:predicted permease